MPQQAPDYEVRARAFRARRGVADPEPYEPEPYEARAAAYRQRRGIVEPALEPVEAPSLVISPPAPADDALVTPAPGLLERTRTTLTGAFEGLKRRLAPTPEVVPPEIADPAARAIAAPGLPGMGTITPAKALELTEVGTERERARQLVGEVGKINFHGGPEAPQRVAAALASSGFRSMEEAERAVQRELTAAGTVASFGHGVAQGTLGVGESIGTAIRYAGTKTDSDVLRETGGQIEQFWGEKAARHELPKDLQGSIIDDPSLMLNPEWLAYGVGQISPSIAASLIPAAAAQKAIVIGGQALRWAPALIGRLAKIGGMVAGGAAGGGLEGAGTYRDVLKVTGDEQKAAQSAELMTLASAGLNALSVNRALSPGAWNSVRRFLETGATEAVTEYLEEPAEVGIKMGVLGPDVFTFDQAIEQLKQGANVIPAAFLTGGLAGAAGTQLRTEAAPAAPTTPPTVDMRTGEPSPAPQPAVVPPAVTEPVTAAADPLAGYTPGWREAAAPEPEAAAPLYIDTEVPSPALITEPATAPTAAQAPTAATPPPPVTTTGPSMEELRARRPPPEREYQVGQRVAYTPSAETLEEYPDAKPGEVEVTEVDGVRGALVRTRDNKQVWAEQDEMRPLGDRDLEKAGQLPLLGAPAPRLTPEQEAVLRQMETPRTAPPPGGERRATDRTQISPPQDSIESSVITSDQIRSEEPAAAATPKAPVTSAVKFEKPGSPGFYYIASKNTIQGEKPWRLTLFDERTGAPQMHNDYDSMEEIQKRVQSFGAVPVASRGVPKRPTPQVPALPGTAPLGVKPAEPTAPVIEPAAPVAKPSEPRRTARAREDGVAAAKRGAPRQHPKLMADDEVRAWEAGWDSQQAETPATPAPAAASAGQPEGQNDRELQVSNMVSNRTLESLQEERKQKRREKDKYAANAVPAQLDASLKMLSEAIRRKEAQAAESAVPAEKADPIAEAADRILKAIEDRMPKPVDTGTAAAQSEAEPVTPKEAPDAAVARAPALADDGRGDTEGEGPGAAQGAPEGRKPERAPRPARGAGDERVREGGAPDAGEAPGPGHVGDERGPGTDREGRAGSDQLDPPTPARDPKRIRGEDYHISEGELADLGGPKQRARQNMAAIRIVQQLQEEKRPATREEQAALVKFVGWGGLADMFPTSPGWGREEWKPEWAQLGRELKELLGEEEYRTARRSTQYAHYTSPEVIGAMYEALNLMGVRGNVRVLEAGAGIGHFVGLSPFHAARWTAIEMDHFSAAILGALYPSVDLHTKPYQDVPLQDGSFDIVVGNPPFGDIGITDRRYGKALKIHDYFFVKSLDKLRAGGVLAYVTSTGTMDKATRDARQKMADRADFLGAVRLPGTAFQKTAGTEVTTDILFFRKRAVGESAAHVAPWMGLGETGGFKINEYFVAHPDQILGTIEADKLHKDRAGVVAREGEDLARVLGERLSQMPGLKDAFTPPSSAKPSPTAPVNAAVPPGTRDGQYIVHKGRVTQLRGGQLHDLDMPVSGTRGARVAKLVELGELARELMVANREAATDAKLKGAQRKLERAYDAFVKEYGPINKKVVTAKSTSRPNLQGYHDPVNGGAVAALESYDDETGQATKTDQFTKRMHGIIDPVTVVDTAWKGVVASLVAHGRVDMPYIVSLYGKDEPAVVAELGARVFHDPLTGHYETAEQYLSGNVREKLAVAKEAAAANARYEQNAEALTEALPKDVTVGQMKKMGAARVGVSWIPPNGYEQFARGVLGVGLEISYREIDGKYSVRSSGVTSRAMVAEWSTTDVEPVEMFRDMLNGMPTEVIVEASDAEGKKTKVKDPKATELAERKKEAIQRRFDQWVYDDSDDRAQKLNARYNELMNHTVLAEWDGEHLRGRMPGVTTVLRGRPFNPAPHQLGVAWRVLANGNTLMAHEVGAGKTIAMILAGMEARRMGIARKVMYNVPNSMLGQFSREFLELYPDAKILVADDHQFHTSRRREFLARVAAEDWDAVIITHDSFKMIPTSPELQAEIVGRMLAEYEEALLVAQETDADRFTVKALEKAKEKYEEKLAALTSIKRGPESIYWEDLGVDMLFVDEAHEYKNLALPTTTRIPLTDAEKTTDLYIKTRHLERVNPGRGIVFATATPVSNSIAEQYVMLRYLMEDRLRALGYPSFDAWANDFVKVASEQEYTAIGTLEEKSRARAYVNTFAMAQMFRTVADVKLAKDLQLDTPDIIGGAPELVVVPGSKRLKRFMRTLQHRWEHRPKKPEKGQDGVFPIINDGRFASVDARLVTGQHAANAGHDSSTPWLHNKAEHSVERIFDIYTESTKLRGTQMVFSDLGVPKEFKDDERKEMRALLAAEHPDLAAEQVTALVEDVLGEGTYDLYNDIKSRLIQKGIPAEEIAFIQEARGNKKKKQEIIDRFKRGQIRVLIGSTPMMGQGVNGQDLMVGMHHIDVPYKPAWLQQREGRIVRQGNKLWEQKLIAGIRILRYALKGSYDPRAWQILQNKIGFIEQGMTAQANTGMVEEVGATALSTADAYAIIKAEASDNPYAMDYTTAKGHLASLKNEAQEHKDKDYGYQKRVTQSRGLLLDRKNRLINAQQDVKAITDVGGDKFKVKIGQREYADRKEAGAVLIAAFDDIPKNAEQPTTVGTFGGFRLSLRYRRWMDTSSFILEGKGEYQVNPNITKGQGSPVGVVATLENMLDLIRHTPARLEAEIKKLEQEIDDTEKLIGKPFPRVDDLEAARAKFAELDAQMAAYKGQATEDTDEDLNEEEPTVTKLDAAEAAARARLAERRKGKLLTFPGLDPADLVDYSIIGAAKLVRGTRKLAAWTDAMVRELGEEIRQHLPRIRRASLRIARGETVKEIDQLTPEQKAAAQREIARIRKPKPRMPGLGSSDPISRRRIEARNRLEKRRARMGSLAERVAGFQTMDPKLRARAEQVIMRALVPTQAQAVIAEVRAAATPKEAARAIQRAERVLAAELHKKAVADLRREIKRALGMKLRPEFLKQVGAAIEDVDVEGMSAKTRRSLEATAEYLAANPDGHDVPAAVLARMANLEKVSLSRLSADDITDIADAVRAALHQNKVKNRLLGRRRRKQRDAVAQAVQDEAQRLPLLPRGRQSQLEGAPKRNVLGTFFKEASTRPEVLIEGLSPTLRGLIYEDIVVHAHADEQRLAWQFRDALSAAVEKAGHKIGTREFEQWRMAPLELQTPTDKVQISRDEAIALLGAIKDPSNLAYLAKNGLTIKRSNRRVTFDEVTFASLQEVTGPEERGIAGAMFRQFNGPMKAALNKAWVDVFGHEVARVAEYWPRSIDMDRAETMKDPLAEMAADREATIKSWGHLRERTGTRAPLLIGSALDTFLNHAGHVARVSAYLAPASNAYAILGRPEIKQALIDRVGEEGRDRILATINMQTVQQGDRTSFERWMRNRMRLFGGAILALRVTTALYQPAGLAISATYQDRGFRNLAHALRGLSEAEVRRVAALATKHSPYWRTRYEGSFARQVTGGLAGEHQSSYGRPSVAEYGMKHIEWADEFAGVIRWRMAESHVTRMRPNLEAGSDAFNDAVARETERLIFRGDNSAHGGDMSGALAFARRNPIFAPAVLFTNSVSKVYSAGVRGVLQAQRGEWRKANRSFAGVIISTAWTAAIATTIMTMGDDDDDKDGLLKRLGERMATDAARYVPVVGGTVIAPVIRKLMGESGPVFDASAAEQWLKDVTQTVVSSIDTIEAALNNELDAQGEAAYKRTLPRMLDGWLELAAQWTGKPYSGARDSYRLVNGILRTAPKELRDQISALEAEEDVTQERRQMLRAIRVNDPALFREAVVALSKKGEAIDAAEVLATINRRYGYLTKYEEGKAARKGLPAPMLALIDQHLDDRTALRRAAADLARENRDVLASERPQRPERPARPSRPMRP